jgi:hypothetical protein
MSAPIQFDQTDRDEIEGAAPSSAPVQEAQKYGPLYDLPAEKAFARAEKLWKKNPWASKRLAGECLRNQWWRDGRRFVRFVSDIDTNTVRLVVPLGMEALPPAPNKTEEIVRNTISTLLADPPRPEVEPSQDSPTARDAAQAATRYLTMMATESGLNLDGVLEQALDVAATFKSSFVEVCVNPQGGGLRPLTIEASPQAQGVEDATAYPGPTKVRYVRPDQTLSDTPEGAQLVWQPGIKLEVLTSNQVRFLPRLVSGIADAEGVIIGRFTSLGELKAKYPDVKKLTPEQQWELVRWKCDDYKRLLPEHYEYEAPKRDEDTDEAPEDDAPVCTLTVYYRSCPLYPRGYYGVFAGKNQRLYNATRVANMPQEEGEGEEPMDIPVAQFRWRTTESKRDPYGETIVEDIGPMDEMRATQYAAAMEYLYRFSKPRWALQMGTPIQPEELADIEKPIMFPPGGKPELMSPPPFPEQMAFGLVDRLDRDMENIASIRKEAMGATVGSVRSAEDRKTIIEQSNIGLTSLRANVEDGYERTGRLILQESRAYLDRPVLMATRGDGGAYQIEELTRADLKTARAVRVRKGTFTMLLPVAKRDVILQEQQAGTLDPQEAARLRRDNIASLIGAEDSPFALQIRRQLQAWRKGPPKELLGVQPTPQIDPVTGQPVMNDPVAQAAAQVFVMSPVHDEQPVAMIRHNELARAVAEVEFYAHPPGWVNALQQTYLHARMAAGVQTVAEQQQAAAAQAQAQQQQQTQDQEKKSSERKESHAQNMERDAAKSQQAADREAASAALKAQSGF